LKVVTVIPARWGSKRLPGKALQPVAGKPLIRWVIESAARAKAARRLLVATDDARIAAVAREAGAEAVMTGPEHTTGSDRCAEAVRGLDADVVINVQGDEATISPALIDRLAEALERDAEGRWDMATATAPLGADADPASPSIVKVVCDAEGRALYFSRALIPHVRDAGETFDAPLYRRHLGIYAYRAAFLRRFAEAPRCPAERAEKLEQLRALHIGARILVLQTEDEAGVGVDTAEDLARAERALRGA